MSALMKVAALADGREFSQDMWVENYDLDAEPSIAESIMLHDGALINGVFGGRILLTTHRDHALRFADNAAAMTAWRTQSKQRPRRPDGRPNRPLSALTVEIEPA